MTGVQLGSIRRRMQLDQTSFGERLGLSRATVSRYESASEIPPWLRYSAAQLLRQHIRALEAIADQLEDD